MNDRHRRMVALLVAGCFFMEILDATIVLTATPKIAESLDVPVTLDRAHHHRVPRDAGGPHPRQRLAHDPVRGAPDLPDGDRALHAGVAGLRAEHEPGRARGDAGPAGRRRGDDGAGRAPGRARRDAEERAPADDGVHRLARARRAGDRPAGRRRAHRVRELALDLPHQHPAGGDRVRLRVAADPVARVRHGATAGPGGLPPDRDRPGRAHLQRARHRRALAVVDARDRPRRGRRGPARRGGAGTCCGRRRRS